MNDKYYLRKKVWQQYPKCAKVDKKTVVCWTSPNNYLKSLICQVKTIHQEGTVLIWQLQSNWEAHCMNIRDEKYKSEKITIRGCFGFSSIAMM